MSIVQRGIKFLIVLNGNRRWLSLVEIERLFDNGFNEISLIGKVMDADGSIRQASQEEERALYATDPQLPESP